MKTFGRTFLLAAAVLALSYFSALPSLAQLEEVEGLNKRIIELSQAKKYAEAIPLAERVLTIREKALGPDHPDVTISLKNLAQLYRAQGRIADAEALERRARAQQKFEAAAAPQPSPPPFVSRGAPRPPGSSTTPSSSSSSGAPPQRSASAAAAPSQSLPDFPWPPPATSSRYELARTIFASRSTVGQVADTIVTALERTGYVDLSFFRTQADGVALVTRLERINDDGTARAESERWPAALQNYQSDLVGFFKGLFFVDRGRYRVIVFILQDRPFVQSPDRVTGQQAREWLRTGANRLPPEVANRPYGEENCSVLIYEFESDGTAVKSVESKMTGKQHLEKAGVLAFLVKNN